MTTDQETGLQVAVAGPDDREVLERLWLMFGHDMSEFNGTLPDREGRFRQERLDSALRGDAGWRGYLLRSDASPVGLAVVRALDKSPHVISSFFLVQAARRQGLGMAAVRRIVEESPGLWSVAFQDANRPAVAFWQRVARTMDPAWAIEHRSVPGRPDLPPDTWVTFTVR